MTSFGKKEQLAWKKCKIATVF